MTDGRKGSEPVGPPAAGGSEETAATSPGPGSSDTWTPDGRRAWGSLDIIEELGRGAFGRVYRARDTALARDVALKIIEITRVDPARGSALLREGQMLARIRHRNVVAVYGAQQIGEEIGLWMELIKGRHLADLVRQDGPMGPEEATVTGISLCSAVAAVHAAGLLHRDIKAHNVMRESGGRIVLMDFGTGRDLAEATETAAEVTTGTPLYMAPELLAGRTASPASDVYSVGVLLFFLVTGQYPVEGRTVTEVVINHGLGRRRLLSDLRPDLPRGFVRVVEHASSPSAEARYQTAGAMMNELADAMPGMSASWQNRLTEALEPAHDSGRWRPDALAQGPEVQPSAWQRPIVRRGALAAGAILFVGVFGFLSSAAFDMQLGRDAGFSTPSPWAWWVLGLRSLVGPAVYTVAVLLIVRTAAALWALARQIVPALSRAAQRMSRGISRLAHRLGLDQPQALAQALLLAQVLAVVLVWWLFRDFIQEGLFVLTNTAPAEAFAWLAPETPVRAAYRPVLTALIVAMVAAWWALLSRPGGRAIDAGTRFGGVAIIVVAVLMLEIPYRLLHQNHFRRVDFAAERCYEVGARGRETLLFCPDASPPRNRIVEADDPRLGRTEIVESIFTPAAEAR